MQVAREYKRYCFVRHGSTDCLFECGSACRPHLTDVVRDEPLGCRCEGGRHLWTEAHRPRHEPCLKELISGRAEGAGRWQGLLALLARGRLRRRAAAPGRTSTACATGWVACGPAARGFVALARRWVVERSFGWLSHWGGLAKDRAGRLDVSAARLAYACVLSGFEALLNSMPIRAYPGSSGADPAGSDPHRHDLRGRLPRHVE
jgi:hypothetical protein